MRVSKLWLLPLAALSLVGCAGSEIESASEQRELASFDSIVVKGIGTVNLTQGAGSSLEVHAIEAAIGDIKTSVSGNTLTIDATGLRAPFRAPVYDVTVKDLKSIELDGAAEANAIDMLQVETLSLTINGAGRAKLMVSGETLVANVSGAGKVMVEGKVDAQTIQIAGVARYDAASLKSRDALVRVTGAGIVTVNASKSLVVSISGGAKVYYVGEPHITRSVTGAGVIQKLTADNGPPEEETAPADKKATPAEKAAKARKWEPYGDNMRKSQSSRDASKQPAQEKSTASKS